MLSRRKLFVGAAAVAVAPTAAAALPARVLDKAPSLPGFIPCDGRELPICDYEKLFEMVKHAYSWAADTQTFRVPDLRGRARVFDQQGLLARPDDRLPVVMHIATGEDERVPAGVVLPMVVSNATCS